MRLSRPFVRLPLRVDAARLAAEADALDPAAWRPHPEGAPGNTAVPLVAAGGDPTDDATQGVMYPTAHLTQLPYGVRVLGALDSVIGRTRLMRIEEEGELSLHVDSNYYWWEHLRVHVPVVTSPDVTFECRGERVHMAAGEVWVFDTWSPHGVVNPNDAPRTHLVADTIGSAALWSWIDRPDRPDRMVEVDGPPVTIVTEVVNQPVVMTPWEMEQTLDVLLTEARVSAPSERLDTLEIRLRALHHAWRAHWALHADAPSGWNGYRALRDEADAVLSETALDLRLPNHLMVAEAIRQLVLRPALGPSTTAGALVAAPASSAPARNAGPVRIERPIFVVSPPRSGSTLLFETLARARGIFTIGGESQRVIEEIAALHPSAHGWDSNRLTAEDATREVVATLREHFAAELRNRDERRPAAGAVRMLEKTPKNALRVPFLAAAFRDATFVSLYRDPRETLSSMLDAWRSGLFITYRDLPDWDGLPWSLLLTPGWRELSGEPLGEVVATQWCAAVTTLLDDLEALEPERWCVASYDRLISEPADEIARICDFCELDGDVDLSGPLPLARHTLDSPNPDKWQRNAKTLESIWETVEPVAKRARSVFGAPPRAVPVPPPLSADATPWSRTIEPDDTPLLAPPPTVAAGVEAYRSVHAGPFAELLTELQCSLAVSTYQSGRVIVVRSDGTALNTHFRTLREPMGIAYRNGLLAIGTKTDVHVFQNQPAVARHLTPPGLHDACFMPRWSHTTGDLRVHDLAYAGDELWMVNTRFSCLATLDHEHSFVPRWRPPFVRALSPEDHCHLNGLAVVDDVPAYVTALGQTDEPDGWRPDKVSGGVIMDVETSEIIVAGLCMPHSPRWHDGQLWVLESGEGRLGVVDLDRGRVDEVARLPGFTRGLGFVGPYAFVGLSQVREHVFDGPPLTGEGVDRNCGVWVVDTRSGTITAFLRFEDLVQELFEVAVLPGMRFPELVEPGAQLVDASFVLPDAALADVPAAVRSDSRD